MTEKQKLMNKLQRYNFAVIETGLFLDTHHFEKVKMLKEEARKEYERKYGPTLCESNNNDEKWDWALGKWPWEVD